MSIRRNERLSAVLALVLCAAIALPAAAAAKESITITFSGTTVTAKGITPKASVLFFAIVTEAMPWTEGVAKLERVVADDDGDGIVIFTMPSERAVPPRSIWAACDLDNGELAIAGPGTYLPQRIAMPGNGLRRGANGQIEKLDLGSQWLEVAVVRPKQGAWTTTIYDGGLGDEDEVNNGHVVRGFAGLKALTGGVAPDHLTGRDVVIVIDPGKMRYYASRIDQ